MRNHVIAASAAALAAVIAAPTAALADTGASATVVDANRSGIEAVPCVGGLAYVTEENHEVMRWAPDASGALHLTDDVNQWFTLTRVDSSGNSLGQTYAGKATIHLAGLLPAGTDPQGAAPNSYVFTVRGVAPSGDTITIREVAHISLGADGDPMVLFDHITC